MNKERFTFRAAAKRLVKIAKTEGIQGLWKGNGPWDDSCARHWRHTLVFANCI